MKKTNILSQQLAVCNLTEEPNDGTCVNFETIAKILESESTHNKE